VYTDVLSARENLLCKFKYFAQSQTLACGGRGGRRSDRVCFMSLKPCKSIISLRAIRLCIWINVMCWHDYAVILSAVNV
jgi:hypothetical protein